MKSHKPIYELKNAHLTATAFWHMPTWILAFLKALCWFTEEGKLRYGFGSCSGEWLFITDRRGCLIYSLNYDITDNI